jgi:F0F1-type ATP synthase epsilon subunit
MGRSRSLHFRIVSPKKVLFEDDAASVSSKNSKGSFDILPGHANFLTIVENAPLQIKTLSQQVLNFDLSFAVIYSVKDQVNIYTDIQSPDSNQAR